MADDRRAHTMAQQDSARNAGMPHHGLDGSREQCGSVVDPRLVAAAVAREIDGDDAMGLRKRWNVRVPESKVAGPAMNEYDGLVAAAFGNIVNLVSVECCLGGDQGRDG